MERALSPGGGLREVTAARQREAYVQSSDPAPKISTCLHSGRSVGRVSTRNSNIFSQTGRSTMNATERSARSARRGKSTDGMMAASSHVTSRHSARVASGQQRRAAEAQWISARQHGNVLAQPKHSQQVTENVMVFLERRIKGDAQSSHPAEVTPGKAMPARWNRISREPGEKIGRVIGGYGRRVEDTSISMDAPPIFQIDAVVQHDAVSALGSEFRVGKVGGGVDMERGKVVHGMSIEQVRDDTSVSADAPLWFHSDTLDAFQRKLENGEVNTHYAQGGKDTFCCDGYKGHGRQVIFEPRPPIEM